MISKKSCKGMLILLILLSLLSNVNAEKILRVNLEYDQANVTENFIYVTEGRPNPEYEGKYEFSYRLLDPAQKVVYENHFPTPTFVSADEPITLAFRAPYFNEVTRLRVYKQDQMIYEKQIIGCNQNGECEETETYRSCPSDCSQSSVDQICNPRQDGQCDPDCLQDTDPDCRTTTSTGSTTSTTSTIEETTTTKGKQDSDITPIVVGIIGFLVIAFIAYELYIHGKKQEKKDEEHELRKWVEERLKAGDDPEKIKAIVKSKGYGPDMVDRIEKRL